jgi:hypothetical protein
MRNVAILIAALAVGACGGNKAVNNVVANTPAPANQAAPVAENVTNAAAPAAQATSLPPGFPGSDLAARGGECFVYLRLAMQAGARPGGRDAPIMEQAAGQWRAALGIDGHMSENEINQLIGSTVNTLTSVPAARRDAAAAWCVENAPEPDPDR